MISTLGDLVAPLTEAEFLTHFSNRTVAFIPTSRPDRFQILLDWDDLNHLVDSGLYPIETLRISSESMSVPTSFYLKKGLVDAAAFSSLMDQGASLIFDRLDKYLPRLSKLCHQIADQTEEDVRADAVVTSGKDGAFPQHYDTRDICVLQIAGSKRWQLYGPNEINPHNGMPPQPAPQNAPFLDEELCAGDFLYVPAGYWHRCENGPRRSLHLSIAFEPPCGLDVVTSLINELVADATFNRPLTRCADANALVAHEAELKARLINQVEDWSVAGFLAERAAAHSKAIGIHIQGNQNAAQRSTVSNEGQLGSLRPIRSK